MVRTTAVGSWPIPRQFKAQLTAYYRGDASDAEAYDLLQAAASAAIAEQRACGLDQIMGGEVFAPDFVHHVPPRLVGLECLRKRDHRVGYEGLGVYKISGDLNAPRGTGHALAFRRERVVAPDLEKAAVPSALTMCIPFLFDPQRVAQMDNLARIVEAEVLEMVAAGAREVQLDAPAEMVALTMGAQRVEQILPHLLAPFASLSGVTRTIHFCLGDMGRRPFTQEQNLRKLVPLLTALDGHVDRVHLECSYAGQWEDRALLAQIPPSLEIIAGIADVKSPDATEAQLREKIRDLLDVVGRDRLLVSTSCGCGRCTPEEAHSLVTNLCRAARSL